MKKYEYKEDQLYIEEGLKYSWIEWLNIHGRDGWMLAGFIISEGVNPINEKETVVPVYFCTFYRPINPFKQLLKSLIC